MAAGSQSEVIKDGAGRDASCTDAVTDPASSFIVLTLRFLAVGVSTGDLHVTCHAIHVEIEQDASDQCGRSNGGRGDASRAKSGSGRGVGLRAGLRDSWRWREDCRRSNLWSERWGRLLYQRLLD